MDDRPFISRFFEKFWRSFQVSMKEFRFEMLLGAATIAYSFFHGSLSYQGLKDNAWEVAVPFVLCVFIIVVKHAIQSAHSLAKEVKQEYAEPVIRSVAGIVSYDGKPITQTVVRQPPSFYQTKIYTITVCFLGLLSLLPYAVWYAAKAQEKALIPVKGMLRYMTYEEQQSKMRNWPYGAAGANYPVSLAKFFTFDFQEATEQHGLNGLDRFCLYYMLKHNEEMQNFLEMNDWYYKEFPGISGNPGMQSMDKLRNLGLIESDKTPFQAKLREPYYSRYKGVKIP